MSSPELPELPDKLAEAELAGRAVLQAAGVEIEITTTGLHIKRKHIILEPGVSKEPPQTT